MRNTSLAAIVVGGGSSSRMQGHDKLYAPLGGRSVLAATVEVFESSAAVSTIILVVAEERVGFCRELARKRSWRKVSAICAGGTSRSHSVANGLQALGRHSGSLRGRARRRAAVRDPGAYCALACCGAAARRGGAWDTVRRHHQAC